MFRNHYTTIAAWIIVYISLWLSRDNLVSSKFSKNNCHTGFVSRIIETMILEMSRNVQSGNTQNLKSTVIQRSFPKWSVAERRKTAAASDQAAVCACTHSRYFAGGSPIGLRV